MTYEKTSFVTSEGEEFGAKLDYIYSKKYNGEWSKSILAVLIFAQRAIIESRKKKRFENYTVEELERLLTKPD